MPDEFHEQIRFWYESILLKYTEISLRARNKFCVLPNFEHRKDFALAIKNDIDKALLFKLLDKKDIFDDICKLIKPNNTKSLIFDKENNG